MTWESANDFFNRLEARDEREWARLDRLEFDIEEMMEDYVGRPNKMTLDSVFDMDHETDVEEVWPVTREEAAEGAWSTYGMHIIAAKPDRRVAGRAEASYEAASMAAAERLRRGVKSAGRGTKHRPSRPVPAELVAWAGLLGLHRPGSQ